MQRLEECLRLIVKEHKIKCEHKHKVERGKRQISMLYRKVLQCNILAGFSILSVKQPVLPVNCPVQSGSSGRNRRKVYFCIYNNLKKEPFGNIPSSF